MKKPSVLIVDYGMGNTGSVLNALAALGVQAHCSRKPVDFEKASHLIVPGVGSFRTCMEHIAHFDLKPLLAREVLDRKKPYLGICLGMQILADYGEEGGGYDGLGWLPGRTERLTGKVRLPHVGWNDVVPTQKSHLFSGISKPIFYFVHNYAFTPREATFIAAETKYGEEFVSAVEHENIFGVQFHPEKSQRAGLELLSNFVKIPSPYLL